MASKNGLTPAVDLAQKSAAPFPNESPDYRKARTALLAEEIELRRHIERVAEQRRALPDGGEVTGDYRFQGSNGPTDFLGLFGDKRTLVVYNWMYGPRRKTSCPMCTSLLSAWDGEALDMRQQVALAIISLSPYERMVSFARERGWRNLPLYSDVNGNFSQDYHAIMADGTDGAMLNVSTTRDGSVRHFWGEEMGQESVDPGQDGRGAPDLMPLWTVLDTTPEGRPAKWYPSLTYPAK
jgi:predicted dithiol-disulfide oxidoreductase (DUF899 family)